MCSSGTTCVPAEYVHPDIGAVLYKAGQYPQVDRGTGRTVDDVTGWIPHFRCASSEVGRSVKCEPVLGAFNLKPTSSKASRRRPVSLRSIVALVSLPISASLI